MQSLRRRWPPWRRRRETQASSQRRSGRRQRHSRSESSSVGIARRHQALTVVATVPGSARAAVPESMHRGTRAAAARLRRMVAAAVGVALREIATQTAIAMVVEIASASARGRGRGRETAVEDETPCSKPYKINCPQACGRWQLRLVGTSSDRTRRAPRSCPI
jgi:hypothetical protein